MKSIVKVLQWLGFWTQPYQNQKRTMMPLVYIVVYILCLIIPAIVYIVRGNHNFASFLTIATETISISNILCLFTNTFFNRLNLERTYDGVRFTMNAFLTDGHDEIRTQVNQLDRSSDRFFKIYIRFEVVVGVAYLFYSPIVSIVQYASSEESPPLHGIFEADFYFFDTTSNFYQWLLIIVISWVVLISLMIMLISITSMNWSLLHHINGLFKVICLKISYLNEYSDERARTQELFATIELQERIYRCVRSMENALNVYMLIQFGTCIIMMCMTMMTLILAKDDRDLLIKMVTMLSYIFFHILVYSMLSTELITASTSIADAIYDVHWYQWSVPEQRVILFVLSRSQRMAKLTTGKFFDVNRETFGKTLQTAVSYFAVLLQLYGSQ
ncbi:odorant receptor 94b-like [Aedes aegypti]|uniref:Odorant receptor n=1 Tax=Aedes aegypti TaxID=7159 RepID=A0A6I8TR23_AEDAE|nr:odorant receptor 32 [Aedes aegypti]